LPTVYIPTLLQTLTGGKSSIEVGGATVRQVIENLELACPGVGERLLDQGRLRPNISVAVDGEVTPMGLLEPVGPSSEVHFIAAIKGGIGSTRHRRGARYVTAHFSHCQPSAGPAWTGKNAVN
jgi:molybdopterin synthase sulfur carrier subunit